MRGKAQRNAAELRKFGLVMGVALVASAGLLVWRDRGWGAWLLLPSGGFAAIGLLAPRILDPVERMWMSLAEITGAIATRVILILVFYLVFTPVGVLLRHLSRDSFGTRFLPSSRSYWVPVDPDGPSSRPDKPF